MTIVEQLRREADASEELDPTDSSIAVMREAADLIESAHMLVGEVSKHIEMSLDALKVIA